MNKSKRNLLKFLSKYNWKNLGLLFSNGKVKLICFSSKYLLISLFSRKLRIWFYDMEAAAALQSYTLELCKAFEWAPFQCRSPLFKTVQAAALLQGSHSCFKHCCWRSPNSCMCMFMQRPPATAFDELCRKHSCFNNLKCGALFTLLHAWSKPLCTNGLHSFGT